jgi:hypothetical protein
MYHEFHFFTEYGKKKNWLKSYTLGDVSSSQFSVVFFIIYKLNFVESHNIFSQCDYKKYSNINLYNLKN